MGAPVALVSKLNAAHRHGDPRADVVAERHRSEKARAVDPVLLRRPPARPERRRSPGCDCDAEWESSVSSAWASTPLASAASIGAATRLEPATVAVPCPLNPRAYRSAACPGGSSEPEIIAAKVSTMWCFACSTTSARQRAACGSGHVRAERGHHRAGAGALRRERTRGSLKAASPYPAVRRRERGDVSLA